MNTKHTPGPWTAKRDSQGQVRIQGNVQGGPVAYIEEMNNTGGTPQDHANARLIAAAPELLDLAIDAENYLLYGAENWTNERIADYREKLRAAIANATGQTI